MLAIYRIQAIALTCILSAGPSFAVVAPRASDGVTTDSLTFPTPPIVRKQIRFWEKVFYKYPSTTVIVHEAHDTDRIVDIIDYQLIATGQSNEPIPRKERDKITQKYINRYTKAVERFRQLGEEAVKFGAIEQRIWNVYKTSPAGINRLFQGEIKLRAQTGLADEFRRAANIATAYLPQMEKVFAQYGVPTKLTRLPFVESMFNTKARSKVGASGIWQFMPATARLFIYVNEMVDERNSPFKATRAAAQLLGLNYRELQSWPLAITAYNHGAAGMQRAAKQVGSLDLGEIIKRYKSDSFGFASRNFYSEFMAAANTYEKLRRENQLQNSTLPDVATIILDHPISLNQILKNVPISREVLAEYNPCLQDSAFLQFLDRPLPEFYEIRVPRNVFLATKSALSDLKNKRFAIR